MAVLKLTAPGVPVLYQGTELIDLSLVDPDNRRPVDYAWRAARLDELLALAGRPGQDAALRGLASTPHDGRPKLWVIARLLGHRARHEALLREGGYAALRAVGEREQHVVAFERSHEGRAGGRGRALVRAPVGRAAGATGGRHRLGRHAPGAAPIGVRPDAARRADRGEGARGEDGGVRLAALFSTLPFAVLEAKPESEGG